MLVPVMSEDPIASKAQFQGAVGYHTGLPLRVQHKATSGRLLGNVDSHVVGMLSPGRPKKHSIPIVRVAHRAPIVGCNGLHNCPGHTNPTCTRQAWVPIEVDAKPVFVDEAEQAPAIELEWPGTPKLVFRSNQFSSPMHVTRSLGSAPGCIAPTGTSGSLDP